MKKLLPLLLAFAFPLLAGEVEPDDWSFYKGKYSVNSSFPYESAVLYGPDFQEGTTILKTYVQGQLESDASFQARLIRIVKALHLTRNRP